MRISKSKAWSAGWAVAAMTIAACSGSPTGTNSGDQLSDAEIQALLAELSGALGSSGVPTASSYRPNQGGVLLSSSVPVNANVDVTAPCNSGNIRVQGSIDGDIDQQTLQGAFTLKVSWEPNACEVTSGTSNFVVNGDPRIDLNVDFTMTENVLTVDGTEKGGFSFTSTDGRSGSCAIDLTFSSAVNTQTNAIDVSVSGTVCGKSAASFDPMIS